MNLPTTKPNDRDIAWYIRECEDLRNRLESLAKSNKKQTDDYVCVDREHGLYRRASHARDAVSADRLALALSLETLDELERDNAALRKLINEPYQFFRFGHKALFPWGKFLDRWCKRAEKLGFKKEVKP